jgi:hypothetical protein
MRRLVVAIISMSVLAGVACSSSSKGASPSTTAPDLSVSPPSTSNLPSPSPSPGAFDPADFVTTIDNPNPYFPLLPGTVLVYEGTRDGEPQRDTVEVTSATKVIAGVTVVVVKDTATDAQGRPIEVTEDWYAQDMQGNVWYFGEDTKELDEQGNVTSTEGSWQTGVDGAVPGVIMPAQIQPPQTFRQEYYAGHAEDMFWIVDTGESVSVPYQDFTGNIVRTIEWTRLEPKVIDEKYYAPGIGIVLEASASGAEERAELVSFATP